MSSRVRPVYWDIPLGFDMIQNWLDILLLMDMEFSIPVFGVDCSPYTGMVIKNSSI